MHGLIDRVRERQLQDFGQIASDVKPDGTLITACDRWSDAEIVTGLASIAPGEGVLSEEGSTTVPSSRAYWVVDPLDGTTNFAAGIPCWAISIARFVDGRPSEVFLDLPALNQRFVALRGRGATRNHEPLSQATRSSVTSGCVSLCSRSIRVLQRKPDQRFPGKIRLFGVASLNLVSVGPVRPPQRWKRHRNSGILPLPGWCWMNWGVRFVGWMRIRLSFNPARTSVSWASRCWPHRPGRSWPRCCPGVRS